MYIANKNSSVRFLELKQELVNFAFCEFTYLDDAIQELKLMPQEIEIQIPRCYRRDRKTDIEWKNKFLDDTLTKVGLYEDETPGFNLFRSGNAENVICNLYDNSILPLRHPDDRRRGYTSDPKTRESSTM